MKKQRAKLPTIACPHCRSKAIVRNSVEVTDLVRELRMTCENIDCGHVFVSQLSVIRTLRPADQPNPQVQIPFGTWRSEPGKPANDDHPPLPANDDDADGLGVAIGAAITGAMTT